MTLMELRVKGLYEYRCVQEFTWYRAKLFWTAPEWDLGSQSQRWFDFAVEDLGTRNRILV